MYTFVLIVIKYQVEQSNNWANFNTTDGLFDWERNFLLFINCVYKIGCS